MNQHELARRSADALQPYRNTKLSKALESEIERANAIGDSRSAWLAVKEQVAHDAIDAGFATAMVVEYYCRLLPGAESDIRGIAHRAYRAYGAEIDYTDEASRWSR